MGSVWWQHLPDCFTAQCLTVGHFFPIIASHDRTPCFKSAACFPHLRKGECCGVHTPSQLSTDREQWSHMASLSPLGSWQWLTTLEWYGLSASKGDHLIWKVIISGGQSFRKKILTSYRGQSQTANECTAQQISLSLQPVSILFKPHTCCSHHFHCSSRCLEGLWGDKQKRSNTNKSGLLLPITGLYMDVENISSHLYLSC